MSLNDAPHIEAHGMLAQLPASVCAVIDALEKRGFEAWVVGGFVRDALRGVAPHDADIATNAHWSKRAKRVWQAAWRCTKQERSTVR